MAQLFKMIEEYEYRRGFDEGRRLKELKMTQKNSTQDYSKAIIQNPIGLPKDISNEHQCYKNGFKSAYFSQF